MNFIITSTDGKSYFRNVLCNQEQIIEQSGLATWQAEHFNCRMRAV